MALEFITAQPDAWITTSDDIAAHYRAANPRLLPAETSAQGRGSVVQQALVWPAATAAPAKVRPVPSRRDTAHEDTIN